MRWSVSTTAVVWGVLALVAGACAQNPPPATTAAAPQATSGAASPGATAQGQNLAGLNFDPQGADFTLWVNRFKDQVYRNWIVPQAALFGAARGHADLEFTIARDGTMSALRLIRSSGTPSLDQAAQNAPSKSRLLPLPDEYDPPRVTMQVSFYYNEKAPKPK
jgi:TonB family protein